MGISRRLRPMKRPALGLLALLLISSCAQQQVLVQPKPSPGTHTVQPAALWGAPENEAEMDILVPPFNPLVNAGPGSQVEAQFRGKDRKAAKTSIADAPVKSFASLDALIATLPSDDEMRNHNPPITEEPTSERVEEEMRNVRVPAFICAIKYEADQDWHIISSSDENCDGPTFFTSEVSGLPRTSAASYQALLNVRHELNDILHGDLPGTGKYHDYKSGPIPVVIQGSTFYDVDHAPGVVGPNGMKPTTAWEIHPITDISMAQ